jgi:hypothetical protein
VLYSQALHMIGPSLAAKPVGIGPATSERALTGVEGALSSSEH